jgi:membrane associated rhomboid family serine protease
MAGSPVNCPHCNKGNFAWSRQCEHCGRSLDPAEASAAPATPVLPELTLALPEQSPIDQERAERAGAVHAALAERGTRVIVTPRLLQANVAMFLIIAYIDQQILTFNADTLLQFGASYAPDVTRGEWWRLMTATFLHGGLLHLASNMFVLLMIGGVTERLFGSAAFAVVYALAGLGGSLASEWWNPVSIGVGASGAIFGLYGGLFAFLLRRHPTLPQPVVRSLRSGAIVAVLYNIVFGFTQEHIDNAGHLGGLVAGFFAGLALTPSGDPSKVTVPFSRSVAAACAGLVITAIGVAALPRYGDLRRNLPAFSELDDSSLSAAQRALNKLAKGESNEEDTARALEQLLPRWRAQRKRLAELKVPPADQDLVKRLVRYMDAREQGWALTAEAMRKRDVTLLAKGQAAHASALGQLTSRVNMRRGPGQQTESPAAPAITLGTSELNEEMRKTQKLDEKSADLYNSMLVKARSGQVSMPDMASTIEAQIIKPWEEQYARLMALPLHGPPAWARQPAADYMRLRLDAWRLNARAIREQNPLLMKQAAAAQRDALAILGETQQSVEPMPVPAPAGNQK